MKFVESTGLAIVNAKIYLDDYTLDNKYSFEGQDIEPWLLDWILYNNDRKLY